MRRGFTRSLLWKSGCTFVGIGAKANAEEENPRNLGTTACLHRQMAPAGAREGWIVRENLT